MSVTTLLFIIFVWEWAVYAALGALIAIVSGLGAWSIAPLAASAWLLARLIGMGNAFRLVLRWGEPVPTPLRITRGQFIACAWREGLAVARSFSFLQPFAPFWARWAFAAPAPGHRPVVLLVPGALCNASVWDSMRAALDRAGFDVEVVNLPSPLHPIATSVPLLDDCIEAICKARGVERIPVVAHSMGGLAIRAYVAAQSDRRLERVITIATPHTGTLFANLGSLRAFREMRPDSNFLKALAAKENGKRQVAFTCIYSFHDNLVAPPSHATLPGARAIAYAGIGHVSLIRDPRVQQQVVIELRRQI